MSSRTERPQFGALIVALATALLATATSGVVRGAAGDDLINQGMTQHQSKNYDAAISAFERYIQLYPNGESRNQAELYAGHAYMLRAGYITNADASAAQSHFNVVLNQGRNARYYKEAAFHTAHLAYEMRNYSNAKELFQRFLSDYPTDSYAVYALYYLANCEKQFGDYKSAIAHYEQALSKYPDSTLRWNCALERASLVGKTGDYNSAERDLAELARQNNLPSDIAGQVAVQRALLQIVQQRYDNAIEILETYISRYKTYNDSAATDAMATVYLHEAYAYTAKKEFQRALGVIETNLERNKNTLIPEAALLKIKLLLALRRNSDASALLDSFANSSFGRDNPDLVTSYQAMLDLTNGRYDQTIDSLTRMLQVRVTSRTSNNNYGASYRANYGSESEIDSGYYGADYGTSYRANYEQNYDYSSGSYNNGSYSNGSYNNGSSNNGSNYGSSNNELIATIDYFKKTGGQNLEPLECVEACGTLILAYASRYASKRAAIDYDYQAAIYRETVNYANWLNDPVVSLILKGIDLRRQKALEKPISSAADSFYVATPYATSDYSSTPGLFADPTNSRNFNRPNYYMDGSTATQYRPRDYYTSDDYRWGNQRDSRRYDSSDPNGYDSSTNSDGRNGAAPNRANRRNADPRYPGDAGYDASNAPKSGSGGAPSLNDNPNAPADPNGAGKASASGAPPQGASAQYGPDGRPLDATGAPPSAPNGREGQNAVDKPVEGGDAEDEDVKRVTPTEAKDALAKAEKFFYNKEFDRCNETLLELLTSSETFWQDCPGVAPQVALLRANALMQLGKRSEAQMSYQSVIDNSPYSPEALIAAANVGFAYDDLGRTQEAADYLRRATVGGATTPLTDKALYLLGMNEKERGNIQGAKQAFARVYRDFPSSPYWSHATWALAALESSTGSDVEAEKLVNEALKSKPDVAIVDYLLFLKGEIALRAKDYAKALVAFDMIVEQYPDSSLYSRAINRLAAIPEKYRGDFDYEEVFEEEVASRPSIPSRASSTPTQNGSRTNASSTPTQSAPRRGLDDYAELGSRRSDRETPSRTSSQPSTSRTTPTGAPKPSSTSEKPASTSKPASNAAPSNGSNSEKSKSAGKAEESKPKSGLAALVTRAMKR